MAITAHVASRCLAEGHHSITRLSDTRHADAVDLDRPPEGVVVLPESELVGEQMDQRAWVMAVRRPATLRLSQPVASYLVEASNVGEA